MENNVEPQRENTQAFSSGQDNSQYVLNNSFMLERLNTRPLVEDIKHFLSNKEVVVLQDQETGQYYEEEKQIGKPLANDEGIMRICNIIRMRVNHHVVQGNFKEDHYWAFIERARKELTETIVKKCYDWEVDDSDLNTVIDEVMALIEAFLTRPVSNLERESYGQQLSAREVIMQDQRKGGVLSNFANGLSRK